MDLLREILGLVFYRIWNFDEKRETLKRKLQQLEAQEADINQQLKHVESSSTKKRKNEVQNWLGNVAHLKIQVLSLEIEQSRLITMLGDRVGKLSKEVMELIENGRFEGGLVLDHVDDTCREPFLTTELVGEVFQINKLKLWNSLMKDDVLSIGIYGMGGIGKTAHIKHIHNQLLQSHFTVYWITVSQDFSTYKLQNLIANKIRLDLFFEGDSIERAAKLSNALEKKQKCVLILDDMWNYFNLKDVGIHIGANGCKLILTTRSLDVCKKMCCQEIIAVNPLTEKEAWRLFQKTLGEPLPSGVSEIAKSITRECDGLPLGIVTMAESMRGVDDVCEWRNALRELQQSEVYEGDMEEKVFRVLRLSYDRLMADSKQCFLSCALFPKDYKIRRVELIDYLIDEEVIKGKSRQAKLDKGHSMLNRLERVCLLEGCVTYNNLRCVKMHCLIRDMAIQIMKRNEGVIIKAGAQLVEIPDVEKWGVDLVKVSLMNNNIKEIPSGHSPRCPNLSTLLLRVNVGLTRMTDSFFEQLNGLKILDLSYTNIEELPGSISHLVNLNALVLRCCYNLKQVPPLALLKILKKLDLFDCCTVENVPQGMEMLSSLSYLDLLGTNIMELPIDMFANLSHLQVLLLDNWLEVRGKELESLRKLEILKCTFLDIGEFNIFTTSTPFFNLYHYILSVGCNTLFEDSHLRQWIVERTMYFHFQDLCEGEDALLLPQNAEILEFHDCNIKKRGLCLKNATQLKRLHIEVCDEIECLLCLSSSPSIFQSLEEICISKLKDLCFLFGAVDEASSPTIPLFLSPPHSTFFLLKEFWIRSCPRMKKLFPPGLVSNFQNLETLKVEYCDEIEEIFAMEEGRESHDINYNTHFSLPKLKWFELRQLPQLKIICRGNITFDSLRQIVVVHCEKLKRTPLSLVLKGNDQSSRFPSLEKI